MGDESSLEKLQAWQVARDLAVFVCRDLLHQFPTEEKYAMVSQLRRAVQSVPANLAEAHGRFHYADATRFCNIARGSLTESLSHVVLGYELGYISSESYQDFRSMWTRASKLINGDIAYLRSASMVRPKHAGDR